jgi:hypothetical protein
MVTDVERLPMRYALGYEETRDGMRPELQVSRSGQKGNDGALLVNHMPFMSLKEAGL